jgi:hypothetical protein
MPNSAFDIYLGDIASLQGYRCRSLMRDSAPLVASKFSTGSQGETDLDLLKNKSLKSLQGGMFQRDWDDDQKAARSVGVFNRYDKNLYPTVPRSSSTAMSSGYYPVAKVESEAHSFIAYGAFSGGTYFNILHKITLAGGVQSIGLPVALASNAGSSITGMTLHKNYLFVASQTTSGHQTNHRYDIDATTWVADGGAGWCPSFVTIRNNLYTAGATIYSITNETTPTWTYTQVTNCGFNDTSDYSTTAAEFNGAAYIAKPSGIYRFDGTNCIRILNLRTTQLVVWNGALYFVAGGWLYKFDGTTVTRIQFFGTTENVAPAAGTNLALSSNSDYLFLTSITATGSTVSYDKGGSIAAGSGLRRIYTYDGVGFHMWHESTVIVGTGYSPALLTTQNRLYDIYGTVVSGSWATSYASTSLENLYLSTAVTASAALEFTASEFDDGYPNVYKALETLTPNYSGMISGDVLTVSYQTYDGKTWSSWNTAGTVTSTTTSTIELTDASKKLFKRLKVNVAATTIAAGSTIALKGVSLGYTLQPRIRWRWQTTLNASNVDIVDRSGIALASPANVLSQNITKSIKQKTPLFFLAPDYSTIKTTVNSVALSFDINGRSPIYTDPYSEYPLIAVKNNSGTWEILRVSAASYDSGTNKTTITVLERGYYGVTAAQLTAGAEVHLAHKVYVTRLLREQPVLDETMYNEQTAGESNLQREFLLEITEV